MSEHQDRDRLTALLRRFNEPPDVPRDAMWSEIRDALPEGRTGEERGSAHDPGHRGAPQPPGRWAWAAAALLVLGIGIGRWTAPEPPVDVDSGAATVAGGFEAGGAAIRQAAYRHLTRTESFLAGVRADARRGEMDPELAVWAEDLLTETRLLMDSRLAGDPRMGGLLEDLELLLVQVRQAARMQRAGEGRAREELELLTRGMDESDVNLRIDAVLPAAAGTIGT